MVDEPHIRTESVLIERKGRMPLPAYFATPVGGGPVPGVLVIHEAGGLNDNIRDVARRFARGGYAALAVDLFAGGNRVLCMARVMGEALLRPLSSGGLRALRESVSWLQARSEVDRDRVGVIGFCMGGGFALALACVDKQVKAASVFYGGNPRPLSAVAEACPIVGSYPGKDIFTRGGAVKLETALSRFGVPHDIKVYPGAQHSFFNDRMPVHNPDAAQDAWVRTLDWFQAYLGQDQEPEPAS